MTTRKRLPNGAKQHMKAADKALAEVRRILTEARADLDNPDNRDLVSEELAEALMYVADAQKWWYAAYYGAHDEDEF
jgi:hypothetical protein